MRSPPPATDFLKYPVSGGTILLASVVSLAYFARMIDITVLLENGGIRRWELWRLITSSLPHGNFLHLAFNLYWTWVFGTLVEREFGHVRTLLIFLLLAVVANGSEYALLSGGIGLSGIGYGLFGLMWVLSRRDVRFSDAVDARTIQLFIAWFFVCIAMTVGGYPIANIAHGAGCMTGALLGWTVVSNSTMRVWGTVAILALVTGVLAGSTAARPWVNLSRFAGGNFATDAGGDEARMGYDALMAHDDKQAAKWYRDAVRMNPTQAGFWFNLGIAFQRTSQNADAQNAYRRACELEPGNEEFQAALAAVKC